MRKPAIRQIVSMVPHNGGWVEQSTLPKEEVAAMVEKTMIRAGNSIGFDVKRISKEKTA